MSGLISAREIEQYRPRKLQDFIGCSDVKQELAERIKKRSFGSNLLIEGSTGSAKTSIIEATVRAIVCSNLSDPYQGYCGNCESCKSFDFSKEDFGLFTAGRARSGQVLGFDFFHINCGETSTDSLLREKLEDVRCFAEGRDTFVFLDEIQFLVKSGLTKLLLKPLTDLQGVSWYGCGASLSQMDPMFLRRFGTRLQMPLPTVEELVQYLEQRCLDWEIGHTPQVLEFLAIRSQQVVGECMSVLARAAESDRRELTMELIKSHPFIGAVTPPSLAFSQL